MPRRAAQPKAEASLPEVLIPPSQAPENQRAAYWLELLDNPSEFKKAVASEEFFPMLQEFPEAFWGNRLSLYLYRKPDEDGRMVKNPEGQKKYIKVFHQPIDEEYVTKHWGGGKYTFYLKLDSKDTLREHTFIIDGAPKVADGQVVEINGKPVSVGAAPAAVPAAETNDIAKVIDAASQANESSMKILAHASETAIDMVKAQSVTASAPAKDPIELAIQLVALLRPAAPATDPMQAELMKKIIDKAFAPAVAPETERPDTPLEQTIDLAEKLTGKSFPDLMKGKHSSEGGEWGWVPPLANAALALINNFPHIMAQANAAREAEFQRQVYLRSITPGQPAPAAPPRLAAPPVPAAPSNVSTMPPNEALDPGQLTAAIVDRIVRVFHKDPRAGFECAGWIAMDFAEQIESFGIDRMLADPKAVNEFVDGMPPLAELKKDARWDGFQKDFLAYTSDRWGDAPDEGEPKTGPQPAA